MMRKLGGFSSIHQSMCCFVLVVRENDIAGSSKGLDLTAFLLIEVYIINHAQLSTNFDEMLVFVIHLFFKTLHIIYIWQLHMLIMYKCVFMHSCICTLCLIIKSIHLGINSDF
jgi:hypothetical protein